MKQKARIALVIGHTAASGQGAVAVAPLSESEFKYNSDIANRSEIYGTARGHEVEVFIRPSRGYSGIEAAYESVKNFEPDCVIELHFNAYNGRVRGSEVLLSSAGDADWTYEIQLARLLQDGMMAVFGKRGRQDRGLKERPRTTRERGWYNVNQTRLFPSVLLEPFFGDNSAEATIATAKRQDYAEMLVDSVEQWLEYVGQQHGLA